MTEASSPFDIVATGPSDAPWMEAFVRRAWGGPAVVVHDTAYLPHELPGFKALDGDEEVGLVTYTVGPLGCEIVTLNSQVEGRGIATTLVAAVRQVALERGCVRLWLVTTNDNLDALRFYQRRGFRLVRVDRDAVERARRIKPGIPLVGDHGIPMMDELELEMPLGERCTP